MTREEANRSMAVGGSRRLLAVAWSLGIALNAGGADNGQGVPERRTLVDGDFGDPSAWYCSNGSEFPGARGRIGVVAAEDQRELRLEYDFSGGGNYVAAVYGGGFPVETTGMEFGIRAEDACHLFWRVADSSKTFQGFYRKLGAGEEAVVRVNVTGPWRNSWGRGDSSRPEPPLRQLWICVQREKDLPAVGAILVDDPTAISTGPLEEVRNLASLQDFGFTALGWRVAGRWRGGWQVLDVVCHAESDTDAALSLTFPGRGEDAMKPGEWLQWRRDSQRTGRVKTVGGTDATNTGDAGSVV